MNFMDRKLFKARPARDKLNKMGGIMSSSQPLMNTVQKFAPGGAVSAPPYARVNPNIRTAPSQVRIPTRTPGPVDPNLAALQRANDPRSFSRFAANLANLPAAAYDTAVGLPAAALQNLSTMAQFSPVGRALGLSEPGEQRPDFVGSQVLQPEIRDLISENQPLSMEDVMAPGRVETMRGPTAEDVKESRQGTKEDAAVSGDLASEYLKELGVSDSFMMPGVTPSSEQEKEPAKEPDTTPSAAEEPATAPPAVEDAPARTSAEDVQKVFDEGSETEVKDQLQSLMDEFTSKAPKFEGMDKGLALAKIGFAMAAGQSPDAITNIATALNQGADMFIKDKKDREAFDRQVKLSGLKYGLTEIGKQRAEERVAEREGRKLKTFIADDAVTIDGKEYGKGDLVPVSVNYIRENGLPSELTTPELVKAAQERVSATNKQISDLIKEGTLSNKDARAEAELYQTSAQNVAGAETAIGLLENSLVDVAEGKVTGLAPAFRNIVRQGGSFFGIDMGSEFKDVDEARASMRFALQEAIPLTVGSAQSANSISDRDVDLLITALFGQDALTGGPFVFATEDPDLMGQRLQRAIGEIRRGQQNELANMESVETRLANMYAPGSSTATGVIPATRQLDPFRRNLEQAGFTVGGRPTRTTAGLVLSGEEDGVPVYDFSAQ